VLHPLGREAICLRSFSAGYPADRIETIVSWIIDSVVVAGECALGVLPGSRPA